MISLINFIWQTLKPFRIRILFLLLSTVAVVLESNVLPYGLKLIVNGAVAGDLETLKGASLFFLATLLASITLFRIQDYIASTSYPKMRAAIRMRLFSHTLDHSHSYFASHYAGSIAGRIGDLPKAVTSIIEFIRWHLLGTLWVGIIAILWLTTLSLTLSSVVFVWMVLHIAVSIYFAKKVTLLSDIHAKESNMLKGQIIDTITNMSTVRLFARKKEEIEHTEIYQQVEVASNREENMAMFKARFVFDLLLLLLYGGVLFALFQGWQKGWASPGDLAFVLFTVFNVMGIAWRLGMNLPDFFSEVGIARQALTLLNCPYDLKDAEGAKPLILTKGEIKFENVSFSYLPHRPLFVDKSITIHPSEKVGLVGFSGSGKSSFVNLILRLFDLHEGKITIDGQDISTVTQSSLRKSIALIPQDPLLFHRSLRENIRYGRSEATDEEVIAASKKAHCHEFIMETEEGYDSLVGERGIKLSGGQRQRIAIARALLKNAPILILDEATSALDSVTEKIIQSNMKELMEGRTTLVVAHRLSTLSSMDRLLVFKEGKIIESGSHDELLKMGGHYTLLWNMQVNGFLPE